MTTYYVGPGGNDGNSGLTWALRKLTLNGVEDIPIASGDVAKIGPGVYRELLTCDVSGSNTYSTGTVSVTKGSDQVTGSGTTFTGNVGADYLFHVRYYDTGADMVTDGTNNVTAAGGNFQATMEGMPIQIIGKGAYIIDTVNAANDIDISDPNGLGWPAAGAGLTYYVMSGEGHYEIESVDDNTTITLKRNWQGRTLTGLAYLTFEPIVYIADVTGEDTDGVGGAVRITGSDNDQTQTRATGINVGVRNYRVFRGFRTDLTTGISATSGAEHLVIEDFTLGPTTSSYLIQLFEVECATVRRSKFWGRGGGGHLELEHDTGDADSGHVVENCVSYGGYRAVWSRKTGGVTVTNCSVLGDSYGVVASPSPPSGSCVYARNSIFQAASAMALSAATLGDIIENFNALYTNSSDRANVGIGANSVSYDALLCEPIFHAGADHRHGFKFPWHFGDLSKWSQLNITGQDERNVDLYGIPRPVTGSKCSWGAVQFVDMELEDTTVQAGSYARALNDAGARLVRRAACSNVSTTVTLYVRRETNYAGSMPRMVIKQPGQSDRTTDMTAAVDTWEQLSDTFTPAATPGYFEIWIESRNTAGSGSYKVFYDTLDVS